MTYPIQNRVSNFFDGKMITILLLIAVIIFLIKCPGKPLPVLQPVTSIAEQKTVVIHDSIVSKRLGDSVARQIDYWVKQELAVELDRDEIAMQNLKLQDQMDAAVTNTTIPDTCKPYAAQIQVLNAKLKQSTIDATTACNSTINAKNNIISNKDLVINNAKKDYLKLRAALDTCWTQQSKLQSNIKLLKPKSSIGIGITSAVGWITPYKFDMGAFLYFRNKVGTQISVGFLTTQQVQLSYSKNLFKF